MRVLMEIRIPVETFNEAILDGSSGEKMQRILEETKPEAAYFTTMDGQRGGYLIHDLEDPSGIPALAEPWFLLFDADIDMKVVMTPDDLGRAGLEELGEKWG